MDDRHKNGVVLRFRAKLAEWFQQVWRGVPMIPLQPTNVCWICGKRVDLETCKTDEYGNAVHEECYAAKMKLENQQTRTQA